jgi:hypothetical protein
MTLHMGKSQFHSTTLNLALRTPPPEIKSTSKNDCLTPRDKYLEVYCLIFCIGQPTGHHAIL